MGLSGMVDSAICDLMIPILILMLGEIFFVLGDKELPPTRWAELV